MTHEPKHNKQHTIVLLRSEHPDPLTDREWVTLMNTKGYDWPTPENMHKWRMRRRMPKQS